MRLVWLAVICAGCFAPSAATGVPCEAACPGEQLCVNHVCREPGDLPPGDSDGDGRGDLDDNCPMLANEDQHDEDGDALGDSCDPCPHLPGDAGDADSDGVGDACDPEPENPRQHLRYFDPFTSLDDTWSGWSDDVLEDDRLHVKRDVFADLAVRSGSLRVETGGMLFAPNVDAPHKLSIEFGHTNNGANFHFVELYDEGDGDGGIQITEADGDLFTSHARTPYGTLRPGRWSIRLDESVADQRIELAAMMGDEVYPTIEARTDGDPPLGVGNNVFVGVRNIDITFDYFVVIETLR
ncbi:MAG: thrombospondin type 3 repeat-containing protein [Kofleriaceae bacterium]